MLCALLRDVRESIISSCDRADMLKIFANVDRQDTVIRCSSIYELPAIRGRLVSVEASGTALATFFAAVETPVVLVEGMVVTWHGRHAGRALARMRAVSSR